ncbi:MAG: RNB domain-containing ribonuclease, partial [Candidatus Aenigmarchaeota archaeon]|nr:RNB domain-containing ribonuclease [Candidatus Aenigmarchaeota archaeon]
EDVKDRPEERLVNHILLRSMKQARYATENLGHFGLASENYTPKLFRVARLWQKCVSAEVVVVSNCKI